MFPLAVLTLCLLRYQLFVYRLQYLHLYGNSRITATGVGGSDTYSSCEKLNFAKFLRLEPRPAGPSQIFNPILYYMTTMTDMSMYTLISPFMTEFYCL